MQARLFWTATLLASAAVPAMWAQQAAQPHPSPHKVYVRQGSGSYLGVGVCDIDGERAKTLKLKEQNGVEIKSVDSGSPAEKAGLKVGDVVLEYNGQKVEGNEQFARLVRETPAGRPVRLRVVRGTGTVHLTASVGTRPGGTFVESDGDGFSFAMPPMPPMPPMPGMPKMPPMPPMPDIPNARLSWNSAALGIESESLSTQLAEFFGVKEGVLVRSVASGTPAEKAGIKAGDVIVRVDGAKVSNPHDVTGAARTAARQRKSLTVTVVREKRELSVTVELNQGAQGLRSVVMAERYC